MSIFAEGSQRIAGVKMRFRVQFLDAMARVIVEWPADVTDLERAIALVAGFEWPEGALRMKIIDKDGHMVHWQAPPVWN